MATPDEILDIAFATVSRNTNVGYISSPNQQHRIVYICRCLSNRAVVRALIACVLAKIHRPEVDIRKPYTAIGGDDCFAGRPYDENYVSRFVEEHELPCNPTTGFLTPALRNHDETLFRQTSLVGRPRQLYEYFLAVLDDVANERLPPEGLLNEIVRQLIVLRDEQNLRLSALLESLKSSEATLLPVESIVNIVQSHLRQPYSSRLPVLAILAVYRTIESKLNERIVPLHAHNAADSQTKALGDIEVAVKESDDVITVYEMKTKEITREDISLALRKLAENQRSVSQYLFITTKPINESVVSHIHNINEQHYGVEFAALDCMAFVRYFLHLFYQERISFLNTYQDLVLGEPESGVSHPLKEVFLTLRQAAESSVH